MSIRWIEWGEDAFSLARASGKPLLLSLTATWCHACHRMDDETWDDPAVAAAVERATVPVRVDADARPDIYGRYHLGGLPSTAILTADGEFVRGGTFLSGLQFFAFLESALSDFRAGRRPSRPTVPPLAATSEAQATVQSTSQERDPTNFVATGTRGTRNSLALVERVRDEVVARLLRRADLEHGGFGSAPKLVEVEALTLLLRRWRVTQSAGLERIVRTTLDAIIEHLQDPRDGGFFRYAAAADWSGPHTEKVAVDQARITLLLFEAGCALGEPKYVESGHLALAHARRRLADQEGRVFASIAADSENQPSGESDRRRFADAGAAMATAAWFGRAVTGEPAAIHAEFREAARDGAIPHRLDELNRDRDRTDRADGLVGLLRDQALGIEATLMEYRMTGDPMLLDWVYRAAEWTIRHLWDDKAGAFRMAPAATDGALGLPPMFPLLANGEMALALIATAAHRRARTTAAVEGSIEVGSGPDGVLRGSREELRRYAERVVETLGPQALVSPAGPAVALAAQRLADDPIEADISGDPADRRAQDLARAVVAAMGAAAVVRWTAGVEPTVIFCVGNTCLPPVRDPRDLLHSLVDSGLAPGGILDLRL